MLRLTTLAALAVLVVLLGACEQQDPEIAEEDQVPGDLVEAEAEEAADEEAADDGDVVETVEVVAVDNDFPEMDDQITLPAGTVEFTLDNQGNAVHNLAVEDTGDMIVDDLDGGEQATGTYTFEDGDELTLICDIPGHEQTMRFDVEVEG